MTDAAPSPRQFYGETVPAQFNRALTEQERAVEAARRVLEGMRAVNATIRVQVEGPGGGTFFLNIADGRMSADDAAAHPPFLTLVQEAATFAQFAREAGDSALGMLGGLAGLASEMKLTQARIRNLDGVTGGLRFEVTGPEGFAVLTHFGREPVAAQPRTTIQVEPETYAELRRGALDPQAAFIAGKIRVEGDLQLAMQLALAALSPE